MSNSLSYQEALKVFRAIPAVGMGVGVARSRVNDGTMQSNTPTTDGGLTDGIRFPHSCLPNGSRGCKQTFRLYFYERHAV